MEKEKIGLWVGVGVVAAAIVIFIGVSKMGSAPTPTQIAPTTGPVTNQAPATPETTAAPAPVIPQQSAPLKAGEVVPSNAFKLTASAGGFSPSSFNVNVGDKVTIALISGDQFPHTLQFDDPALSNFSVGISPGETRTIEIVAPKKGEYTFSCGIPGHAGRGETGKMIVK